MSFAKKFIGIPLLFLLLLPATNAFSNDKIIDSLRNRLPYIASDTQKVWMLRDIAYYYQSSRPDSAVFYAERGYQLARSLNFTSGRIWNLYQKGLGYELSDQTDKAFEVYHRALDLALQTGDDLSRAHYLSLQHRFVPLPSGKLLQNRKGGARRLVGGENAHSVVSTPME